MKLKLLVATAFSLVSFAALASQTLPPCSNDVCTQVVHNKDLEKLSVLVWDDKGHILHSSELSLDRTAKLVHSNSENALLNANNIAAASSSNPPSPCASGACSSSSSTTYTTATHIVTVTITFTYENGELVGVNTSTARIPRRAAEITTE